MYVLKNHCALRNCTIKFTGIVGKMELEAQHKNFTGDTLKKKKKEPHENNSLTCVKWLRNT